MSARKLRRLAGFVFVLAVAFGGASSATSGTSFASAPSGGVVEATNAEVGWG
jgi:hypothetical protein